MESAEKQLERSHNAHILDYPLKFKYILYLLSPNSGNEPLDMLVSNDKTQVEWYVEKKVRSSEKTIQTPKCIHCHLRQK